MEDERTPANSAPQRLVKIKTMENAVYELRVPADAPIPELKKAIHEVSGTAPERQRLICKAKLLLDEKKLSDYVEEDGQFIHLLKNQAPAEAAGGQPQPQRRTEQDFNNTLGRQPGPPQGPVPLFNPFQSLGSLFGGLEPGTTNIVHINTITQEARMPHQPNPAPSRHLPQPAPVSAPLRTEPAVRLVAANHAPNHLVSVGPTGVEINLRNLDQATAAQTPTLNFLLPTASGIASPFFQQPAADEWPQVPRRRTGENSLTVVGNYIQSINLQINLLLPAIQRFAEVAQLEAVLNDAGERRRLMELGNQLGVAFERLVGCLQPAGHILRNLRLGNGAGNFGFASGPVQQGQQPEPAQAAQAPSLNIGNVLNPNPQGGMPMDFENILGEVQNMLGGVENGSMFAGLQGLFGPPRPAAHACTGPEP